MEPAAFFFFTFMAGLYISNRPGRNNYLRRTLRRGGIFYRPPQGSASGDGISHSSYPGIMLAFLFLGVKTLEGLLLGAFLSALAALSLILLARHYTKLPFDGVLASILSSFFRRGSRSVFHHPAYRKCQPVRTESIHFRTGIHYSLPRRPSHRNHFYFYPFS